LNWGPKGPLFDWRKVSDVFRSFNVHPPGMYSGTRTTSTRRGPIEKDADKILAILNQRSFNADAIAYLMLSENEVYSKPLFDLAIAILNGFADKNASCTTRNDEEYNLSAASRFTLEQIITMMGNAP
jgi:hypothetical protein